MLSIAVRTERLALYQCRAGVYKSLEFWVNSTFDCYKYTGGDGESRPTLNRTSVWLAGEL
jgi:hypothetical protein